MNGSLKVYFQLANLHGKKSEKIFLLFINKIFNYLHVVVYSPTLNTIVIECFLSKGTGSRSLDICWPNSLFIAMSEKFID